MRAFWGRSLLLMISPESMSCCKVLNIFPNQVIAFLGASACTALRFSAPSVSHPSEKLFSDCFHHEARVKLESATCFELATLIPPKMCI